MPGKTGACRDGKAPKNHICNARHHTKSAVVQLALEKYLSLAGKPSRKTATANPFASLRGTGNRKLSTEQIMRMTRGDDWNRP